MQLDQLITKFEEFQEKVNAYSTLLLKSSGMLGDIEKNHDKITKQRSILNREHAGLQKYILGR